MYNKTICCFLFCFYFLQVYFKQSEATKKQSKHKFLNETSFPQQQQLKSKLFATKAITKTTAMTIKSRRFAEVTEMDTGHLTDICIQQQLDVHIHIYVRVCVE